MFLLIVVFSDVQGKVISFVEGNGLSKSGSSGADDGYRIHSLATGPRDIIISNVNANSFTLHDIIMCAMPVKGTTGTVVEAGKHSMAINKENSSSSVYFCRMTSSDFEETQKLTNTHTR